MAAGDRLLGRRVRVIMGSVLFEDLHVSFKVKKTSGKEPNECELKVFNLAESTRAGMKKGTKLILEAGYETTLAQIFAGDARQVDHERDGPNWVTTFKCGDGERAYRWARVNDSFKAGTSRFAVVQRVADQMGLDAREALATVQQYASDQFAAGFTAWGKASTVLDRLLSGTGLVWSIQDGKLQILPRGGVAKDAAVLLKFDTGLLGTPTLNTPNNAGEPSTLKALSLLQPNLKPGGKVRIESTSLKGNFRITTVTHSGDVAGGDWQSEIEGTPL